MSIEWILSVSILPPVIKHTARALVADMPVRIWDKWGVIIQELREHLGSPDAYLAFDYLASELRKHIDSESHKKTLDRIRKPVTHR